MEVSEVIADALKPGARACLTESMSMEEAVRAFKTVLMKEAMAQCGGVARKAGIKLGTASTWVIQFLEGRNPPLRGEYKKPRVKKERSA